MSLRADLEAGARHFAKRRILRLGAHAVVAVGVASRNGFCRVCDKEKSFIVLFNQIDRILAQALH
jgi:hypothetical protein